jgi:hypothetical protein
MTSSAALPPGAMHSQFPIGFNVGHAPVRLWFAIAVEFLSGILIEDTFLIVARTGVIGGVVLT